MRRFLLTAVLMLAAVPLAAQNTDIESLSGLQFNFGNPGARSLGMGGAFLGLADDASAAEANPAGLTILRKPEVSLELRNYLEQQMFTTSGTFPAVERTAFTHYSSRVVPTFGSFVYPVKKFTLGLYFHQPLLNAGAGQVWPVFDQNTGRISKRTPNFYLPDNGTPVTAAECDRLNQGKEQPVCFEYRIDPFISALDVRQRTYGFAAGWQVLPTLSIGASARYQLFKEGAFTFRFSQDPYFDPTSISVQATARENNGAISLSEEKDLTFGIGFKWAPNDKFSFGGAYKQGAEFATPVYVAAPSTDWSYVKLADTTFHMPDTAGLGVSIHPRPELTINADAVYVKYSNLVDRFIPTISDSRNLNKPFKANNVTELHVGGEYFFTGTKVPMAFRAGFWRDPAHAIEWQGPLTRGDFVAEAMLYPRGEAQNHVSVGGGLAWPRFQIDVAYDQSAHYKVGSLSMLTRF